MMSTWLVFEMTGLGTLFLLPLYLFNLLFISSSIPSYIYSGYKSSQLSKQKGVAHIATLLFFMANMNLKELLWLYLPPSA